MWIKRALMALLIPIAGCATLARESPQPNIYVIRHLHTPAGGANPDLTDVGQRHAVLLDAYFRRDPPDVIYVSNTKRAQQSAAPLAGRLKLTPKVYDPADTPGLVATVTREPGTILIVGHSNTVPEIVAQLGGTRPGPLVHEDFGDIWRVTGPKRVTTHARLGE